MAALHGLAGSAPNLAYLQGATGFEGDALRSNSFTAPDTSLGSFTAGTCAALAPLSAASSASHQVDVQQLQLELAAALAAQPQAAGAGRTAQEKLQLLEQLQLLIAQQQQALQLQLQHYPPPVGVPSQQASANLAALGAAVGAARLSNPGDDLMLARDQVEGGAAGGCSAAGSLVLAGQLGLHPLLAPLSAGAPNPTPLQLQLQHHLQQQQYIQQEVMSPCAFMNTPTALAALPPSLLAEVGVDAAASVLHHTAHGGGGACWQGGGSAAHRLSSSSSGGSQGAGCFSSAGTTPTASQAGSKGSRLARTSGPGSMPPPLPPAGNGSGAAGMDGSAALLQHQLQQAIAQLASLQISSNTGAGAGAAAGPGHSSVALSNSSGSKGWDWASVGDLLRTDSITSRGSSGIARAGSGIPSETSVSSNIWSDAGTGALGGMLTAATALALPSCSTAGMLLAQGSGLPGAPLGGVALQRTTSNVSCASAASGCNTPCWGAGAGPGAGAGLVGGRCSAGGGGMAGGGHDFAGSPWAGAGAGGAAAAAAAASAARPRASVGGQDNRPEPGAASTDTLLRSCAPRWAKAGWNPKAAVAAAPGAAAKGTGAFVRLSQSGGSGGGSAGPEGKPAAGPGGPVKGTGAFIPPAVRAALAAAAGLTPQQGSPSASAK